MSSLESAWFSNAKWVWCLAPLTLLFWLVSGLRRALFRMGILASEKLAVPVVVVGNISVGGNGKTPVVIWLVEQLQTRGLKVGVISRGYGGQAPEYPYDVSAATTPAEVGDEPQLIFERLGCPVVVGSDRVASARHLLKKHDVDVIISDDGMQHYRLQRDVEIAVIDGQRRHGNGFLLPMGPLREDVNRLNRVDAVICNGDSPMGDEVAMQLQPGPWQPVNQTSAMSPDFSDAVGIAGIGNPQRFFNLLSQLHQIAHFQPFSDHHAFSAGDMDKLQHHSAILMTEKDAVKCRDFAPQHAWYLPVNASLPSVQGEAIIQQIMKKV